MLEVSGFIRRSEFLTDDRGKDNHRGEEHESESRDYFSKDFKKSLRHVSLMSANDPVRG